MEHKTYQKINTLYKRDTHGKIMVGEFSEEAFGYLYNNKWLAFEKIDGTNMSWYWDGKELSIHGKTEATEIPNSLKTKMETMISIDKLKEIFPPTVNEEGVEEQPMVIIYGEGYGNNIQKYGKKYISDNVDVKIFDININGWWLKWDDVKDIANRLNIETVPEFGVMTLEEAEKLVKKGFKSTVSEDKDLNAEGLVLRPIVPISNRSGERIIVKIKTRDYRKIGIME